MAVQFGVVKGKGLYGYHQSFDKTNSAEEATAQNESGNTEAAVQFNEMEEVAMDVILDGTLPAIGASITVDSTNYGVTNVQETESNTDYKRANISAKRYVEHNVQPGLVSET